MSTPLAELAERARQGDRTAYDRLFACVADRLQLFVRMRLGAGLRRTEESLDVLQDTYLAAHQDFGDLEWHGDGAFLRWLCAIAENRMRRLAQHHGAQKRGARGTAKPLTAVLGEVAQSGHGVVTQAARAEQRARLEQAMAALNDDERRALLLRHFEHLELAELATRLGRSESAVRRLLGRATKAVGRMLREPSGGGRS